MPHYAIRNACGEFWNPYSRLWEERPAGLCLFTHKRDLTKVKSFAERAEVIKVRLLPQSERVRRAQRRHTSQAGARPATPGMAWHRAAVHALNQMRRYHREIERITSLEQYFCEMGAHHRAAVLEIVKHKSYAKSNPRLPTERVTSISRFQRAEFRQHHRLD